jgi:hypothetical protein
MSLCKSWPHFALLTAILVLGAMTASSPADDSASVRSQFAQPPREYSSSPLWVWNDRHTEQDIRGALRELAGQGVKQAFVHPRFGLMTPYLSDEWFNNWGAALDEARKLDMNVWIYDENSYPSGFAGAWISELMPEAKGQGLTIVEAAKPQKPEDDVIGVYRATEKGYENLTAQYRRDAKILPDGKYFIALRQWAQPQSYFAYRCYVDLLRPGVTEKFLDVTLEPYRRRFGDEFGKRIPGVFTDEATYHAAGEMPWTPGLPAEFKKRFGYDLLDHLPSLRFQVGDWRRIRHDFCLVLLEQFINHWAKPYHDYCEKNKLEFTGHYFEHDWPNVMGVPDNLSLYPYHQRPAVDALFNSYREHTNHHFGGIRIVKELSSAANQCGRKRTLCEAYGAGGWDLRFEDMKRNGDWLYVGGVNTLNQHLSFISVRGARKQDCPQSFSPHAPWWSAYHVMADYFTRLSLALSSGEEVNKILVIEPTSTVWMYQADPAAYQSLMTVGNGFFDFILNFSKQQVEYDLGSEHSLANWGNVEGNQLVLQKRKYPVVVLPPHCETLRREVAELLQKFLAGGGRVICADAPPTFVDARPSDVWKSLSQKPGWKTLPNAEIAKTLKTECPETAYLPQFKQTAGLVFHLRRQLKDGQFIFAVNSSLTDPATFTLDVPEGTLTEWDLFKGTTRPVALAASEKTFTLLPAGSTLLFYSPNGTRETIAASEPATVRTIRPLAPPTIKRQDLNVLTLDYVDVTAKGQTLKNTYFHKANHFVFRQNGMPRGNPWEVTIQYRDETLKHQFPADSGFEATYRFTLEQSVPAALEIVIERPDLYQITCNGTSVTALKDAWWLDKSFGRIDLGRVAKVGENTVVLRAKPMTVYHELEAAYLRGEFNLRPKTSGFAVVPPRPLTLDAHEEIHVDTPDNSSWLTCGIGFNANLVAQPPSDGAPFVTFDLDQSTALKAVQIWNYNETNLRHRGAKDIRLTGSADGTPGSYNVELGRLSLEQATGKPQKLDIASPQSVRFVKLDVLSNHNGVTYPTTDGSRDNAFTGLSKVHFLAPDAQGKLQTVPNVKVASMSSELTSFGLNRRAQFLVGREGLSIREGWRSQGHPFYSAGVSYRETFSLSDLKGTYAVRLPRWFGSVAAVKVNDKLAGYVFQQPWECDVTKLLKPGNNQIEVVVFGTLKNLFGAHHFDPPDGMMGDFAQGPDNGPPPGNRYDVIAYGLFEPFVLQQREP